MLSDMTIDGKKLSFIITKHKKSLIRKQEMNEMRRNKSFIEELQLVPKIKDIVHF